MAGDARATTAWATRALLTLPLAVPGLLAAGCAGATQNVRALRAYAHEDASIQVSLDRIEDIARTLELVDRILLGTPYTPGDIWVRRLPPTASDARAIKEELRQRMPYSKGEFEVPILKVYRAHVERALEEYRPPPEPPKYSSILDAVASLSPELSASQESLKAHWTAYRDATIAAGDAIESQARLTSELAEKDEATRSSRAVELAAAPRNVSAAVARVEAAKRELARDTEKLALVARSSNAPDTAAERGQIARDSLAALSVAFRIELEALALVPIVVIQTVRALPTAPNEVARFQSLKAVRQLYELPYFISGIKERLERQSVVLSGMSEMLARALATSVDESPGFQLRESVVDQIVGVTLDSFRVDLRAGGEAFIYNSVPTSEKSTSKDGKTSFDYSARQFKLEYRVQPIILASARLDVVLDWIQLPGAASLGFGYSTDRAFRSGGTIEQTSLASQLGIKGAASDVFDFGVGLIGVRSAAKIATFHAGEVRRVDARTGTVSATAPLKLTYTQVDVGYDVLFALRDASIRAWLEELVVGFRYVRYALPRILYELTDRDPDPARKSFVVTRESPAQNVESTYYLAGLTARLGVGESPRFSPFADVALFGGSGPTSFYFLRDPAGGDVEANRESFREAAFVFDGGLGLGLRWRLLPRGSRVRLDLRGLYRTDLIYTSIHRSSPGQGFERRTDYGGFDVFHGPALALRGAL